MALLIVTCMCVIAINVTQIGLIGYYPDWYEALLGPLYGYFRLSNIGGHCRYLRPMEKT